MNTLNSISLPLPSKALLESFTPCFEPIEDMPRFIFEQIHNQESPLFNPDHQHLLDADILFLFTNTEYKTKGRRVLGQAEELKIGNKWSEARKEMQLRQWCETLPDFIITLDARFWMSDQTGNPERLALLEHELYHCAQKHDQWGAPMFNKRTGQPLYCITGHDVEEFVGVVARYGAEATRTNELVDAANKGPTIATADINGICGSCLKNVA